ncbi:MAG: hypothetical protein ACI95T_000571 [Flavobacteriales bacterium]|jgi:hypothetical protein
MKETTKLKSTIKVIKGISKYCIPKFKIHFSVITVTPIIALFFSINISAQLPNLGVTEQFALFTTTGAVGNTATSFIGGSIGSNAGAISGFGIPTTVTGTIESANALTAQGVTDVLALFNQLSLTPQTVFTHPAPAFGSGETVLPGVYYIAGAGSVGGNLILDGQGDYSSVFIFKFGGAFNTGAASNIILTNGALPCNVFWSSVGAIAMGANTQMKGTLISSPGAVSMAAGGILEGRMLSTTGAVAVDQVTITHPGLCTQRLWVKADDGTVGSPLVSKWENQNSTNDSLYTIAGEEPTYVPNSINYNPSLLFDGATTQMIKPEGVINSGIAVHTTTFVVSMPNSIKNQYILEESLSGVDSYGIVDVWGDGKSYFDAGTLNEQSVAWGGTLNTPYLWSFIQSNTAESISRNGLEISTKAGGSLVGNGDTTFIGSDNINQYYDGNIAEIMNVQHVSGKTFLQNQQNIIESYLAIKYGITLDQVNDNDNDGTVGTDYSFSDSSSAWEDSVSTTYIHDIAGIGQDDFYGLDQRQSKSVNPDGMVTIGLMNIATNNLAHLTPFSDNLIALMWANNDSTKNIWVKNETQAGFNIIYRIKREWLVEENYNDVGELLVQIDSADLPIPPMGASKPLYLVVDEDKDGDFSTGELRLSKMDKTNGVWQGDINLADGEYFTFMYIQFDRMRHGKFFFNGKEKSYNWLQKL